MKAVSRISKVNSDALAALVRDEPQQLETHAEIEHQEEHWLVYAKRQIVSRDQRGDYASVVRAGEGKKFIDDIRGLFTQFIFEAEETRNTRVADSQRAGKVTFAVSAAFLAASMALIIVATQRRSAMLAQVYGKVLAETRLLNKNLEERVEERTRCSCKRPTRNWRPSAIPSPTISAGPHALAHRRIRGLDSIERRIRPGRRVA